MTTPHPGLLKALKELNLPESATVEDVWEMYCLHQLADKLPVGLSQEQLSMVYNNYAEQRGEYLKLMKASPASSIMADTAEFKDKELDKDGPAL